MTRRVAFVSFVMSFVAPVQGAQDGKEAPDRRGPGYQRQLVFGTVQEVAHGTTVILRVDEVIWGHLSPGQVIRYCFRDFGGDGEPFAPGPEVELRELKPGTQVFASLGKWNSPLAEYESWDRYGLQAIITSPVQRDQVRERTIREYKLERHARSSDAPEPPGTSDPHDVTNGAERAASPRAHSDPPDADRGHLVVTISLLLGALVIVGGSIAVARRKSSSDR